MQEIRTFFLNLRCTLVPKRLCILSLQNCYISYSIFQEINLKVSEIFKFFPGETYKRTLII